MTAAPEGGEWSAARPGRTLPPGKSRYLFYRRLGGPQGRSGRAENLVPTGIRSRDRPASSQSLLRLSYPGPQPDPYIPCLINKFWCNCYVLLPNDSVDQDSVGLVVTATRYGLDGPGIESRWGRDFSHPSRPNLGHTHLPIPWILGLFPGGKAAEAWR